MALKSTVQHRWENHLSSEPAIRGKGAAAPFLTCPRESFPSWALVWGPIASTTTAIKVKYLNMIICCLCAQFFLWYSYGIPMVALSILSKTVWPHRAMVHGSKPGERRKTSCPDSSALNCRDQHHGEPECSELQRVILRAVVPVIHGV